MSDGELTEICGSLALLEQRPGLTFNPRRRSLMEIDIDLKFPIGALAPGVR